MDDFKGRHFEGQVIPWAVRWSCKQEVSCRKLQAMLEERGVAVTTPPSNAGRNSTPRAREAAVMVLASATLDQLTRG